jgi:hypothetical protein
MNQRISSKKPYIIIAIVVILAACVYFYYQGTGTSNVSGLLQASGDNPDVSAEVTAIFSQIQALKIDKTLFADVGYSSLQDNSVPVPPQNVGRLNPFAPIPGVKTPGTVVGGTTH